MGEWLVRNDFTTRWIRIENFDYVPVVCLSGEWLKEPKDMKVGPEIPEDAQ